MTHNEARKRIDELKQNIFIENMKDMNVDYAFIRECESKIKELEPFLNKHGYYIRHHFTKENYSQNYSYINPNLMHDDEPYLYETIRQAQIVFADYMTKYPETKDDSMLEIMEQ